MGGNRQWLPLAWLTFWALVCAALLVAIFHLVGGER